MAGSAQSVQDYIRLYDAAVHDGTQHTAPAAHTHTHSTADWWEMNDGGVADDVNANNKFDVQIESIAIERELKFDSSINKTRFSSNRNDDSI